MNTNELLDSLIQRAILNADDTTRRMLMALRDVYTGEKQEDHQRLCRAELQVMELLALCGGSASVSDAQVWMETESNYTRERLAQVRDRRQRAEEQRDAARQEYVAMEALMAEYRAASQSWQQRWRITDAALASAESITQDVLNALRHSNRDLTAERYAAVAAEGRLHNQILEERENHAIEIGGLMDSEAKLRELLKAADANLGAQASALIAPTP